jgi:hypothetical protein
MTPAWKFALVVLILLLVNAVPGLVVPPDIWLPWRVISWMLTIAMLLLALAIVGTRMTRDWRGVLVDRRNVMSMSRLQLVLWTVVIVSAILTSGIANVAAGATDPLLLKVPPEIWALLGISGTAFVATPLILDHSATQISTNGGPEWAWADIFLGDKVNNDDKIDLSKVQQFFFTVIVIAIYMMKLGYALATAEKVEFPTIDPGFVVILGISNAAYLIHKAT